MNNTLYLSLCKHPLHKQIYNQYLNELDADIIRQIVLNPIDSEEARLLNKKVYLELCRILNLNPEENDENN